jgi:hypothetical protein
VQQYLLRPLLAISPYRNDSRRRVVTAWLMEASLNHLIALARPFPIPMRYKGLEVILDARSNPSGSVLCSVHLPLVRLVLRLLVDLGIPPTAVIANEISIVNGRLPVWTTAHDLPGFIADTHVLFKARTILRRGGSLAALIDSNFGDPPNANVFRLIRSVGSRVVFFVSELQSDGAVLIEFLSPPDPFCTCEESVLSNMLFMQESIDRVLHLPSRRPWVATLSPRKAANQARPVSLVDSSS